MIRFCDNEVTCVLYNELDRRMILSYFFQDHMDEIVCVLDEQGKYKGNISYYSLINTDDVFKAMKKDYVILDRRIWEKARCYFANYKNGLNEHVLLPVVNKSGELLCFAYEDYDANREIRMLKELMENTKALQFTDIYPQYECVKIIDFNELAYCFANYLKKQNIPVQIIGTLWDGFYEMHEIDGLKYKCLTIYAEGIHSKNGDRIDNLLKSVSVEFECIDLIYETNIKKGIFQNAEDMDLFDFLKTQNELVILGSGREELDVYDLLIGKNIDVCCFVNDNYSEQSHKMFGKNIISSIDARNKYKKPIFIECSNKYSAWGFGGVDYYDYIGYRRNKNFFLIKDYIDIKENSLQNILSNKKIVLAGHIELCEYLYKYLVLKKYQICGHLVDGQKNNNWEQGKMPEIYPKDVDKDTVCLMVAQEDYLKEGGKRKQLIDLAVYLKQNELDDYTEYFSYMESLIEIEQCNRKKYTKKALIPRKIVLGSIEGNSGNAFFRGLLDNHPSILMINHCNFSDSLFRYCIILSMKDSNNILSDFWKMYKKEQEQAEIFDPDAFNSKMNQLLSLYKSFSPQELFVVFHVAFMYMRGREIAVNDIKNMLIYWEPHNVDRKLLEDCAKWLGDEQVNCDIINVVRNKVMSSGDVKRILLTSNDVRRAFTVVLNYPSIDKKDFLWCDRLVVKFEDIKCNPHDVLFGICKQWGIEWSDTLMTTTSNGEKIWHTNRDYTVCDFDLKPVYNLNEKYFSEFDRFRIMLINAPWLRKYEYPYVNMVQFTRRELYDMFSKRFRFEKMISYQSKKLEDEFKIELFFFIRAKLQKVRMMEIIGEYNF